MAKPIVEEKEMTFGVEEEKKEDYYH